MYICMYIYILYYNSTDEKALIICKLHGALHRAEQRSLLSSFTLKVLKSLREPLHISDIVLLMSLSAFLK